MATNSSATDPQAGVNPLSLLPKIPPLDNTFGALLIGTFIGLMQYGWTLHQGYRYFRTYKEDMWLLKALVSAVLVLETFHTVLCVHATYHYLVTSYFNPLNLGSSVWSINMMGVVTGATILVSQLFFLRRVYKIGREFRAVVVIAALLLLTEFGLATSVTVDTFLHPTLHNSDQAWMNSAGVGICTLADTILTAALIFSLHRSRTGVRRTDSLIDVLILYAINTGLVTGIVNGLSFIFALVMPNNLIYVAIDIVATKLYANTLMAVLNSRRALASQTTGLVHSSSMDMSGINQHTHGGAPSDAPYTRRSSVINVTVSKNYTSHSESQSYFEPGQDKLYNAV